MRKGWFWAAVALSVSTFVAMAGLITAGISFESRDAPGLIDDPSVLDTIDDECSAMIQQVESYTAGSSRSELVTAILDQNKAVIAMVDAIEALPAKTLARDRPTRQWLDDWRDLVAVRAAYASALQRPSAPDPGFRVPRDTDGQPITVRMEDALYEDVCRVPRVLVEPRASDSAST